MATNNSLNSGSPSILNARLAAVTGAIVAGNVPRFADSLGTINDSGISFASLFNNVVLTAITSSGTYTPTSGMLYVLAFAVGGGGAGGGTNATTAIQAAVGGGGAGGQISISLFSAATIGASQSVTIGAGGIAGGTAAGNTTFGALLTARGAVTNASAGAAVSSATNFQGSTGAPGSPTPSGIIYFQGNTADTGIIIGNDSAISGNGAGGLFGGGGNGFDPGTGAAAGNSAAANTGAGGSGAASYNTVSGALSGGNGGSGLVLLLEFIG